MNRLELASMIDHTLLKPEATEAEVEALVSQGVGLGVFAVCISPTLLPIDPQGLKVATVCGFPSGAHTSLTKAAEAKEAALAGADEIDMVMNLGLAKSGDWAALSREIDAVRDAAPDQVLKVIIESAALSDEEIVLACRASQAAGANFVKTASGFHPSGGASVRAVRLMKDTVGDSLEVKASGGIRTLEVALAMIEAGATRLGLSGTAAILAELDS